jgi:phospholipid transport system substrate-binding protein
VPNATSSVAVSGKPLARWFLSVASVALMLSALAVAAQEPAVQLIQRTIDAAFVILRAPALRADSALRLRKLREAVDPAFDWEAMARSSLGAPWRQLTAAQRTDFVAVFKELLAQRYMDDIDRFQGSEELKVTGSEVRDDLTVVKTTLITSSREQIPIDYSMRATGDRWRAEDVSIEGISLVNHYRKTFARFLTNKSFDELMAQLKQRRGGGAAAP